MTFNLCFPRLGLILLLGSSLLASGCASIASGQNQPISVSTPGCDGASCEVQNDKGKWYVPVTPGTVIVSRAYDPLQIRCSKDNNPVATTTAASTTKAMAFGNILFGGIIGAGVDISTGAAYDYPTEIALPMNCSAAQPPAVTAVSNSTSTAGLRLGCTVKTMTQDLALAAGIPEPIGVLVTSIEPDGIAKLSGVQVGDVLTHLNSVRIQNVDQLRDSLQSSKRDSPIILSVFRERQVISFKLKIADKGSL